MDDKLVSVVETSLDNKGTNQGRFEFKPVSDRAAADILKLTGVDTTGFKTVIEQRMAEHIVAEHGPNGKTDHSMADVNDIGRIQYVLDNYDSMSHGGHSASYTTVKPNGMPGTAQTVLYKKAVNGTYFIVEAVPDTKKQTAYIVSAYMANKKAGAPNLQTTDELTSAHTAKPENAVEGTPYTTMIPELRQDVNEDEGRPIEPDTAYLEAKGRINGGAERYVIPDTEMPAAPALVRDEREVAQDIRAVEEAAAALGENGRNVLNAAYRSLAQRYRPEEIVSGFFAQYNASRNGIPLTESGQWAVAALPATARQLAVSAGQEDTRRDQAGKNIEMPEISYYTKGKKPMENGGVRNGENRAGKENIVREQGESGVHPETDEDTQGAAGDRPGVQEKGRNGKSLDREKRFRERHQRLTEEAATYGLPVQFDATEDWPTTGDIKDSLAYTEDGIVHIRADLGDDVDDRQLIPHEATHATRQLGFKPYLDFLEQTQEMIDMSSEDGRVLFARAAAHRQLDPFNLKEKNEKGENEYDIVYDEVNALISGAAIIGEDGNLSNFLHSAFYDYDSYKRELQDIHRRFKKRNAASSRGEQRDAGGTASYRVADSDDPESWTAQRLSDGKAKSAMPLTELISKISHDFGLNITTGHLQEWGTLGQYNRRDKGIRTRVHNALPTVCHELGHALADRHHLLEQPNQAVHDEL